MKKLLVGVLLVSAAALAFAGGNAEAEQDPVVTAHPMFGGLMFGGQGWNPRHFMTGPGGNTDIADDIIDEPGILITGIIADSPAQRAGLLRGDVILKIDGTDIEETESIRTLIADYEAGQTIALEISRGGTLQTVELTLETRLNRPLVGIVAQGVPMSGTMGPWAITTWPRAPWIVPETEDGTIIIPDTDAGRGFFGRRFR